MPYRHPKRNVADFTNNFLNNLLKKVNQEQKKSVFGNVDIYLVDIDIE